MPALQNAGIFFAFSKNIVIFALILNTHTFLI